MHTKMFRRYHCFEFNANFFYKDGLYFIFLLWLNKQNVNKTFINKQRLGVMTHYTPQLFICGALFEGFMK